MASIKKPVTQPQLFLVDNGSLRADAILALRGVADNLSARLGRLVIPASVLHSSKVPPGQLDGTPAETIIPALRRRLIAGQRNFRLLPFFFGPSRAFTEYLPEKLDALRAENPEWADFALEIAPPLFDDPQDDRIARALTERIDNLISRKGWRRPAVVLVDHGSPEPKVTSVRDGVGEQLRELLGDRVVPFAVSSMERREGAEYDFNEPMLERVLRQEAIKGPVVVALMFLSPGRHAGPAGDIAQICAAAQAINRRLDCAMTEPLGNHPLIEEILAERATSASVPLD